MFRNLKKKRVIVVLAALAVLGIAGGAYAYFTGGSSSVNASGTVGSPSTWAVTTGTPTWSGTLTSLYPGATNDTELLPFTVTNNSSGHQAVMTIAATVMKATNGDAETASGTDITNCLASWFTATVDSGDASLPADLAAGGTYTGKIDLTMQDVNTSQNACQGAAPGVTITAS
ncbi:MAG TPA: hypothetical protein VME22_18990 [Solirubrobacteraceae bacterium]|nr:hypothetical protein [Solirubrobacteraceae bacterium]